MRAMISMPMAYKSQADIKHEFRKGTDSLEHLGYKVVNTLFDLPESQSLDNPMVYYLGEAIKKMAACSCVLFMPGWENARGCRIEHEICKEYGIYHIYYDDINN